MVVPMVVVKDVMLVVEKVGVKVAMSALWMVVEMVVEWVASKDVMSVVP